ncbi:MAG: hypothetical protein ACJ8C4_13305 [Gemmataceae bacterium]
MSNALTRLCDSDDLPDELDRDWHSDFCALMRWLREHGYRDYVRSASVDQIEGLAANPAVEDEADAMEKALGLLQYCINHPPWSDLTSKQRIEVRRLVDLTYVGLRARQRRLSTSIREYQLRREAEEQRVLHRLAELNDNVIVAHGNRSYSINRQSSMTLTDREDTVLQAFLAQPSMDKPSLEQKSGYFDGPRVLKRLMIKYGGMFAPAILLPVRRSQGGYRVSIRSAR